MLAYPEPPLSERDVSLWPWMAADAGSLVSAWRDASIAEWNAVPADRSLDNARRWIQGEADRRRAESALDMMIVVGDKVAGEVGLAEFRGDGQAALLGYWLHADFRGYGYASRAVRLFVDWALQPNSLSDSGLEMVVARCAETNIDSHRVVEASSFDHARDDGQGNRLYMRRRVAA